MSSRSPRSLPVKFQILCTLQRIRRRIRRRILICNKNKIKTSAYKLGAIKPTLQNFLQACFLAMAYCTACWQQTPGCWVCTAGKPSFTASSKMSPKTAYLDNRKNWYTKDSTQEIWHKENQHCYNCQTTGKDYNVILFTIF